MTRRLCVLLMSAALLATNAMAATSNEPETKESTNEEPKAVRCIDLKRIKTSEILGSQHIVFEMSNRERYMSTLSHPCPGMRPNTPYLLRPSTGRLCDLDIITMLNSTGFGFMPGASCGLGPFEPVSAEQVEMVKRAIATRVPGN